MNLADIVTYIILGIFVIGGAFLLYAAHRSTNLNNNNDEQKK